MEATLYQVDKIDSIALAPLLFKVLEQGKKVLIYCENSDLIRELDNSLWSYGRNKFLPHITIFDKDFDLKRQPIILSNEQKNFNEADYLIILDVVEDDFLKQFSRVFCFTLNGNINKNNHLKQSFEKNSFTIKSYKKDGVKWISA